MGTFLPKQLGPFGVFSYVADYARRNPLRAAAIAWILFWGILMLSVVTLGPACWISQRTGTGSEFVSLVYWPLIFVAFEFDSGQEPEWAISAFLRDWMAFGMEENMRPVRIGWSLRWVYSPERAPLL